MCDVNALCQLGTSPIGNNKTFDAFTMTVLLLLLVGPAVIQIKIVYQCI